jgi:hypothetical protein
MWGDPEPTRDERKHLEEVRASARDGGRQVEDIAMRELEAKGVGPGTMARPSRGYREAPRWGGQYRRASAADYDWYDALTKFEQKRLYSRWFAPEGHGESPDEMAERMPIKEWLRLTRQADLGKAMASGRGTNAARFGGLRPSSMIAGEPYDFTTLHGPDDAKAAAHIRKAQESGRLGVEGQRCQFRTSPSGVVYPLANTCRGAYVTSEPARDYSELDAQGAF